MAKSAKGVSEPPAVRSAKPRNSSVQVSGGGEEEPSLELVAKHILTLNVNVEQQFVGRIPGGYRVDLSYSGARPMGAASGPVVPVDGVLDATLYSYLQQGCILSGNDWVTINSETAFDFDSRITIALGPDDRIQCPVSGRLRGRAQLRDVRKKAGGRYFDKREDASKVFADWRAGFEEGDYLPLVLSAAFDLPMKGLDDAQDEVYEKARALANSLFIGQGKAVYGRGPYGNVTAIRLHLYTVEPNAGAHLRGELRDDYAP